MYACGEHGVQDFLMNVLDDLAFIDEREEELERVYGRLKERGLWCETRFYGILRREFPKANSLGNEIASVLAEVAHQLGYLTIDQRIWKTEWRAMRKFVRESCPKQDWHVADVVERFGEPSLVIGGAWDYVHCYVSEGSDGWLFCDYANAWVNAERPGWEYGSNPILRDVRLPTPVFRRGVVRTPYGQTVK